MMNRKAASGVDGESTEQFASEMEERVEEICRQLKAGMYRTPAVRRVEIPKGPGKSGTRPLGIPTVADRLLQRAVARILEVVFEADFLDCSFGFRPGHNPHHALQALRRARGRDRCLSIGARAGRTGRPTLIPGKRITSVRNDTTGRSIPPTPVPSLPTPT